MEDKPWSRSLKYTKLNLTKRKTILTKSRERQMRAGIVLHLNEKKKRGERKDAN